MIWNRSSIEQHQSSGFAYAFWCVTILFTLCSTPTVATADLWVCDKGGTPVYTTVGDADCTPFSLHSGSVNRSKTTTSPPTVKNTTAGLNPTPSEKSQPRPPSSTLLELGPEKGLEPALEIVRGFKGSADAIADALQR